MTLENCRQIRLLTWTSLIGQLVHQVGRIEMGYGWRDRYYSLRAIGKEL